MKRPENAHGYDKIKGRYIYIYIYRVHWREDVCYLPLIDIVCIQVGRWIIIEDQVTPKIDQEILKVDTTYIKEESLRQGEK